MPEEVPSPDAPPAKPQRVTKWHMRQLLKQYELALYQHQLTLELKQKEYYRLSRVAPLKSRSRLIILIDKLEEQVATFKEMQRVIAIDIRTGRDYEQWRGQMVQQRIKLIPPKLDVVPSAASAAFSGSSSQPDTSS